MLLWQSPNANDMDAEIIIKLINGKQQSVNSPEYSLQRSRSNYM